MTRCQKCGLEFTYDAKYHKCAPRANVATYYGESWLEEVKRKQGLREWKEDRK